jgi:uncharacterized protein
VRVRNFDSPRAYLSVVGDFLIAREAQNNLIFGLCSALEADPSAYPAPPYLAAVVEDDGTVVACALRTPPWRLVLASTNSEAAIELLAADVPDPMLPGVQGPQRAAEVFARAWSERTGRSHRLSDQMRVFSLSQVRPPRPTEGAMRDATPADQAVVARWLSEFHDEATPDDPAQNYDDTARRWINRQGRRLVIWEVADTPVSLSGITGPTPNGIRIGPVYTPPSLRGRGYASNLVAAATQSELDSGRRFVFLFTDLSNPTSNKIYEAIGYEAVADVDEYAFE